MINRQTIWISIISFSFRNKKSPPPTHKMLDTLFPPIKNTKKNVPVLESGAKSPNRNLRFKIYTIGPPIFVEQKSLAYEVLAALGRLANMKSRSTRSQGITGWQILRDRKPTTSASSKNSIVFPSPTWWQFRLVAFREKIMVEHDGVDRKRWVYPWCIMYHVVLNDSWWMKMNKVLFWTGILAARSKRKQRGKGGVGQMLNHSPCSKKPWKLRGVGVMVPDVTMIHQNLRNANFSWKKEKKHDMFNQKMSAHSWSQSNCRIFFCAVRILTYGEERSKRSTGRESAKKQLDLDTKGITCCALSNTPSFRGAN